MTADQLNAALADLDWTGAELGRRIDVDSHTVSAWRTDKRPVPGAVAAYLDLLIKVRALSL